MTGFTAPFDRRQTLALASLGGVAAACPASAQTVAERKAQPVPGPTAVMMSLADCGSRAKWVTSVCTGSLALAAAGLLNGCDATSHWQVADPLPRMGSRHVDQRVVIDRNRMTGGGVTAGIDFGLTLAAHLKGEEAARRLQLLMEYAHEPPFHNGTPKEAGPTRVADLTGRTPWMNGQVDAAVTAAAKRLGIVA